MAGGGVGGAALKFGNGGSAGICIADAGGASKSLNALLAIEMPIRAGFCWGVMRDWGVAIDSFWPSFTHFGHGSHV
jgi:hypothetical protein